MDRCIVLTDISISTRTWFSSTHLTLLQNAINNNLPKKWEIKIIPFAEKIVTANNISQSHYQLQDLPQLFKEFGSASFIYEAINEVIKSITDGEGLIILISDCIEETKTKEIHYLIPSNTIPIYVVKIPSNTEIKDETEKEAISLINTMKEYTGSLCFNITDGSLDEYFERIKNHYLSRKDRQGIPPVVDFPEKMPSKDDIKNIIKENKAIKEGHFRLNKEWHTDKKIDYFRFLYSFSSLEKTAWAFCSRFPDKESDVEIVFGDEPCFNLRNIVAEILGLKYGRFVRVLNNFPSQERIDVFNEVIKDKRIMLMNPSLLNGTFDKCKQVIEKSEGNIISEGVLLNITTSSNPVRFLFSFKDDFEGSVWHETNCPLCKENIKLEQ